MNVAQLLAKESRAPLSVSAQIGGGAGGDGGGDGGDGSDGGSGGVAGGDGGRLPPPQAQHMMLAVKSTSSV